MAVHPGRYELGTNCGRIILRTFRDGLAAQAGHDLTIEVGRWSGELTLNEDLRPTALEVRVDLHSLIVRDGTGGLKPLSDRDRREIAVTARKVLVADRHPEATFVAREFLSDNSAGGVIRGSLTLAGVPTATELEVSKTGEDKYRATASVVQSEHGIKPYTGFLGALRVRDAVDVEADIDLSEPAEGVGSPGSAGTDSAGTDSAGAHR
jgi:polyisoprenoid-binding protein YceI